MKKILLLFVLFAFGGLGFATSASAQDITCSDIVWSDAALEMNPNIADYCLDVLEKQGRQVALLRVRVVRQSVNSTIVRWQLPDGTWSESDRRYPDRGFTAQIGDRTVRVADLPERQEVNVYVPAEDMWSVPSSAYATTSSAAAPAAATTAAAAPAAAAAAAPAPEPEPEPEPAMLPTTATQLPLLALLGGLFIMLGGAVGLVRSRM